MDMGKRRMLNSDRETNAFSASSMLYGEDNTYTANVVSETCKIYCKISLQNISTANILLQNRILGYINFTQNVQKVINATMPTQEEMLVDLNLNFFLPGKERMSKWRRTQHWDMPLVSTLLTLCYEWQEFFLGKTTPKRIISEPAKQIEPFSVATINTLHYSSIQHSCSCHYLKVVNSQYQYLYPVQNFIHQFYSSIFFFHLFHLEIDAM